MNNEDLDIAGFSVQLQTPSAETLAEGFNIHGVRENYVDDELESIDVIFNAMEPGIRKGVEITPEFLDGMAQNAHSGLPVQYDHSHSQRANVGTLKETKFSENFFKVMLNIPNTGSSIRTDTIADFTHTSGPQITDGSIGLNPASIEFEESDSNDADVKFVDAELIEFSLTPFPGGYDNGGIANSFSEKVRDFVESTESEESQIEVYRSQIE